MYREKFLEKLSKTFCSLNNIEHRRDDLLKTVFNKPSEALVCIPIEFKSSRILTQLIKGRHALIAISERDYIVYVFVKTYDCVWYGRGVSVYTTQSGSQTRITYYCLLQF